VLGVVAHELVHHHFGDARAAGDRHQNELRADYWAGAVLAAAGVDPSVFASVLREISPFATPTHPAWSGRIAAMSDGFNSVAARVFAPGFCPV
jgi:hypothetical protein